MPDSIAIAEAVARARYPIPSDILDGALGRFRDEVILDRDKTPDGMSLGALRYFMQHYFPAVAGLLIEQGVPGSAQGWGAISVIGFEAAARVYRLDQITGWPPRPSQPASPQNRELSIDEARAIVFGVGFVPGQPEETQARALDALHDAGDRRWGRTQSGLTGKISEDRLALNVPRATPGANVGDISPYQLFDFMTDTGLTWIDDTGTQNPGSTFVPWTRRPRPISRLTIDGTRFFRDGQPVLLAGMTSMDLGVQWLRNGDVRWFDFLVEFAGRLPPDAVPYARLIVSSFYRSGSTPAEGAAWLPDTLTALAARGLYAEVCLADSAAYQMSRADIRAHVAEIGGICAAHPNAWGFELTNEVGHDTVSSDLSDPSFRRELVALVPAGVPVSAGSSHGGDEPMFDEGQYLTHHAARGVSPEENARIMAAAQDRFWKPVADDEAIGFAETLQPGRRENDPEIAFRQARAARDHWLAATLIHLEAGPYVDVDRLGPIQRAAVRRFAEGLW